MATEPEHQTAVWYFVAATFMSVLPSLLFREHPWLYAITIPAAVALIAVGMVTLRREQRAPRAGDQSDTPPSGDDGSR